MNDPPQAFKRWDEGVHAPGRIRAAAAAGDLHELWRCADEGYGLEAIDAKTGNSALWLACANARDDAASMLLSHGARANQRNAKGRTPLWVACRFGYAACVQALLAHDDSHVLPRGQRGSSARAFTPKVTRRASRF